MAVARLHTALHVDEAVGVDETRRHRVITVVRNGGKARLAAIAAATAINIADESYHQTGRS